MLNEINIEENNESEQNDFQLENKLIFGRFKVKRKLGEGSFAKIYIGINTSDRKNEKVVIKLEQKNNSPSLLQTEASILYLLKGFGIPLLKAFGIYDGYYVLVESLLGKSLKRILSDEGGKLSKKDCCMIAIQIIDRLEFIHSKYFIHRDIKPENLLIGDPDIYNIYLIDFCLAKKYRSSRTKKHVNFTTPKKFSGSMRYASCNSLEGVEQSRRDDLESTGYTILYLFNGKLPWQNLKTKSKDIKLRQVYKMKKFLEPEKLCENLPSEMTEYMEYVLNLKFEEKPDYDRLRFYFNNILKKLGTSNDMYFNWIKDEKILKEIDEINNKNYKKGCTVKRKRTPESRIFKKLLINSLEREKNFNTIQKTYDISKKKEYINFQFTEPHQINLSSDANLKLNINRNISDNTLINLKNKNNQLYEFGLNNTISKNERILKKEMTVNEVCLGKIKEKFNINNEINPGDTIEERYNTLNNNFIRRERFITESSEQKIGRLNSHFFNSFNENIGNNNVNYRLCLKQTYLKNKKQNNGKKKLTVSEPKYNNRELLNLNSSNYGNNYFINNNHKTLILNNNNLDKLRINTTLKNDKVSGAINFNNKTNINLKFSKNNYLNDLENNNICYNKDNNGSELINNFNTYNSNLTTRKASKENICNGSSTKIYYNYSNIKNKFNLNDLETINSYNFSNLRNEKDFNTHNSFNYTNLEINNNQTNNTDKYNNTQIKPIFQRYRTIISVYRKNTNPANKKLTHLNYQQKLTKQNNCLNNHKSNSTNNIISKKLNKINLYNSYNIMNVRKSLLNNQQRNNKTEFINPFERCNFVDSKNINKNRRYNSCTSHNILSNNMIKRYNNNIINKGVQNNINYKNVNIIKNGQTKKSIVSNINNINFQEQINNNMNQNALTSLQYKKNDNYSNGNNYKNKAMSEMIKKCPEKNNDFYDKKRTIQTRINNPDDRISNRINNNLKIQRLIKKRIERNKELVNKNINIKSYSKEKQTIENNKTFQQNYINNYNNYHSNILLTDIINNEGNQFKINNKEFIMKNNINMNGRYETINAEAFATLDLSDI